MSDKPWKNEKTTLCETDWNRLLQSMPIEDARNLERRMRAAERLLEEALECAINEDWSDEDGYAHLEAAKKEDGQ